VKPLDLGELLGLPWQIFADEPTDPYLSAREARLKREREAR
jgi:hypothetical protein